MLNTNTTTNTKTKTKTNASWCARVLLVLMAMGVASSAHAAAIYDFTFTDSDGTVTGSGSFTTDGPSPDAGYDLVTSLTFDLVLGENGILYNGPFEMVLVDGAAYNPITGLFINHAFGNTYTDIGTMLSTLNTLYIQGTSFRRQDSSLLGRIAVTGGTVGLATGRLDVSPRDAASVPEPTSLALLGTGLLGLAARRRRARQSSALRCSANRSSACGPASPSF